MRMLADAKSAIDPDGGLCDNILNLRMDPQWLTVKVRPSAGKDVLVSIGPGRFEAWVKAKPVEGRANQAVIDLLARDLHIPRERLKLVKGWKTHQKVVRIVE